jgi:hypothetical protein
LSVLDRFPLNTGGDAALFPSKYMLVVQLNAGSNHSIDIVNRSFGKCGEVYLFWKDTDKSK